MARRLIPPTTRGREMLDQGNIEAPEQRAVTPASAFVKAAVAAGWMLRALDDEPAFWSRPWRIGDDLNGYDPLSDSIIENTAEAACKRDNLKV